MDNMYACWLESIILPVMYSTAIQQTLGTYWRPMYRYNSAWHLPITTLAAFKIRWTTFVVCSLFVHILKAHEHKLCRIDKSTRNTRTNGGYNVVQVLVIITIIRFMRGVWMNASSTRSSSTRLIGNAAH
jgi:hypothetical protein